MTRTERGETIAQVLILLAIAGMAGAASFTHVHDWTMHNAPPGTGSWFGWANAVISELTPTAAGIEIRRRKRHHHSATYPMGVLIAAAVLSLAAQVAEARPTVIGWISSAVPAVAFLALTKLILGRPAAPAHSTPSPEPGLPGQEMAPSAQLLISAQMTAFAHQQATGKPITAGQLAERLTIPPALAATLLPYLDGGTPPPVTAVNGTPLTGGRP